MGFPFRGRVPFERPLGPMLGHKLAYPMLSGDGQAAGFRGIWSSAQPVYGLRDTAVCFFKNHPSPPHRRCGCGFYCLHSQDAAYAMACEGRYRSTVVLDVEAAGRFIRYEEGLRYSDQRVLAVHLNRCACGRPASVLVDSGTGVTGWLQLKPSCLRCGASMETISAAEFGSLLGDPALVGIDGSPPPLSDGQAGADEGASSLSVLAAEVALLQARVDSLQAQLSRLTG